MATIPFFTAIRIIPRESDFLDRKTGSRGEIFYDRESNTLRLFNGTDQGGVSLAKDDLTNVSNAAFLAKATAANIGGAGINSFSTIAISGQSNVVADSSADILTFEAGDNIAITTNAATDTITISSQGYTLPTASISTLGGVKVDGSTIVINDGVISSISGGSPIIPMDPYTFFVAADDSTLREISSGESIKFIGAGTITTSSDTEGNITISSSNSNFSGLSDTTAAGLTVDEIYLPAITSLTVTNSGASAYLFDQYSGNNPEIYALNGATIAFKLNATGHPFLIQTNAGVNYNTGLVHVSTSGVVSTGASAQGKDSGTLYWKIPDVISGNYRYQCSVHAPMVGTITIKNFASI